MVCPASVSLLIHPNAGLKGSPTKSPSPTSSPVPTRHPVSTLPLVIISGDNGNPSSSFPLGLCEGDCDNDSDCANGLICYERSGTEPVPGCKGSGVSGKDYCYDPNLSSPTAKPTSPPTSAPTIRDNGNPSSSFPLGICEGDCDNDSDCANGLICYERSGTEPVPGCEGSGVSGKDYCYDPNLSSSTSKPTSSPTSKPTSLFFSSPTHEPSNSPTKVPPSNLPLVIMGDNGGDNFPLGRCEGDCDNHEQCQVG
ncbi:hypothetical protein ACHAXS_004469 [Conticribra weissflogii]